jgi:hypothetical protein
MGRLVLALALVLVPGVGAYWGNGLGMDCPPDAVDSWMCNARAGIVGTPAPDPIAAAALAAYEASHLASVRSGAKSSRAVTGVSPAFLVEGVATEVVVTGTGLGAADRVALVLGGSCAQGSDPQYAELRGALPSGAAGLAPGVTASSAHSTGREARFVLTAAAGSLATSYVAHTAAELASRPPQFSLCYDFGGANDNAGPGHGGAGSNGAGDGGGTTTNGYSTRVPGGMAVMARAQVTSLAPTTVYAGVPSSVTVSGARLTASDRVALVFHDGNARSILSGAATSAGGKHLPIQAVGGHLDAAAAAALCTAFGAPLASSHVTVHHQPLLELHGATADASATFRVTASHEGAYSVCYSAAASSSSSSSGGAAAAGATHVLAGVLTVAPRPSAATLAVWGAGAGGGSTTAGGAQSAGTPSLVAGRAAELVVGGRALQGADRLLLVRAQGFGRATGADLARNVAAACAERADLWPSAATHGAPGGADSAGAASAGRWVIGPLAPGTVDPAGAAAGFRVMAPAAAALPSASVARATLTAAEVAAMTAGATSVWAACYRHGSDWDGKGYNHFVGALSVAPPPQVLSLTPAAATVGRWFSLRAAGRGLTVEDRAVVVHAATACSVALAADAGGSPSPVVAQNVFAHLQGPTVTLTVAIAAAGTYRVCWRFGAAPAAGGGFAHDLGTVTVAALPAVTGVGIELERGGFSGAVGGAAVVGSPLTLLVQGSGLSAEDGLVLVPSRGDGEECNAATATEASTARGVARAAGHAFDAAHGRLTDGTHTGATSAWDATPALPGEVVVCYRMGAGDGTNVHGSRVGTISVAQVRAVDAKALLVDGGASGVVVAGEPATLVVRGTGLGTSDMIALVKGAVCPSATSGLALDSNSMPSFGQAAGAAVGMSTSFAVTVPTSLAAHTLTDNVPDVSTGRAAPLCLGVDGSFAVCRGSASAWSVCYSFGGTAHRTFSHRVGGVTLKAAPTVRGISPATASEGRWTRIQVSGMGLLDGDTIVLVPTAGGGAAGAHSCGVASVDAGSVTQNVLQSVTNGGSMATFTVALSLAGSYSVCYYQRGVDGRELVGAAGLLTVTAARVGPTVFSAALRASPVSAVSGTPVLVTIVGAGLSAEDDLLVLQGASDACPSANDGAAAPADSSLLLRKTVAGSAAVEDATADGGPAARSADPNAIKRRRFELLVDTSASGWSGDFGQGFVGFRLCYRFASAAVARDALGAVVEDATGGSTVARNRGFAAVGALQVGPAQTLVGVQPPTALSAGQCSSGFFYGADFGTKPPTTVAEVQAATAAAAAAAASSTITLTVRGAGFGLQDRAVLVRGSACPLPFEIPDSNTHRVASVSATAAAEAAKMAARAGRSTPWDNAAPDVLRNDPLSPLNAPTSTSTDVLAPTAVSDDRAAASFSLVVPCLARRQLKDDVSLPAEAAGGHPDWAAVLGWSCRSLLPEGSPPAAAGTPTRLCVEAAARWSVCYAFAPGQRGDGETRLDFSRKAGEVLVAPGGRVAQSRVLARRAAHGGEDSAVLAADGAFAAAPSGVVAGASVHRWFDLLVTGSELTAADRVLVLAGAAAACPGSAAAARGVFDAAAVVQNVQGVRAGLDSAWRHSADLGTATVFRLSFAAVGDFTVCYVFGGAAGMGGVGVGSAGGKVALVGDGAAAAAMLRAGSDDQAPARLCTLSVASPPSFPSASSVFLSGEHGSTAYVVTNDHFVFVVRGASLAPGTDTAVLVALSPAQAATAAAGQRPSGVCHTDVVNSGGVTEIAPLGRHDLVGAAAVAAVANRLGDATLGVGAGGASNVAAFRAKLRAAATYAVCYSFAGRRAKMPSSLAGGHAHFAGTVRAAVAASVSRVDVAAPRLASAFGASGVTASVASAVAADASAALAASAASSLAADAAAAAASTSLRPIAGVHALLVVHGEGLTAYDQIALLPHDGGAAGRGVAGCPPAGDVPRGVAYGEPVFGAIGASLGGTSASFRPLMPTSAVGGLYSICYRFNVTGTAAHVRLARQAAAAAGTSARRSGGAFDFDFSRRAGVILVEAPPRLQALHQAAGDAADIGGAVAGGAAGALATTGGAGLNGAALAAPAALSITAQARQWQMYTVVGGGLTAADRLVIVSAAAAASGACTASATPANHAAVLQNTFSSVSADGTRARFSVSLAEPGDYAVCYFHGAAHWPLGAVPAGVRAPGQDALVLVLRAPSVDAAATAAMAQLHGGAASALPLTASAAERNAAAAAQTAAVAAAGAMGVGVAAWSTVAPDQLTVDVVGEGLSADDALFLVDGGASAAECASKAAFAAAPPPTATAALLTPTASSRVALRAPPAYVLASRAQRQGSGELPPAGLGPAPRRATFKLRFAPPALGDVERAAAPVTTLTLCYRFGAAGAGGGAARSGSWKRAVRLGALVVAPRPSAALVVARPGALPSSALSPSVLVAGRGAVLVVRGLGLGASDQIALVKGAVCPDEGFGIDGRVSPSFGVAPGSVVDSTTSFAVTVPTSLAAHTLTDNVPDVSTGRAAPLCLGVDGSFAVCRGSASAWSVCYSFGGAADSFSHRIGGVTVKAASLVSGLAPASNAAADWFRLSVSGAGLQDGDSIAIVANSAACSAAAVDAAAVTQNAFVSVAESSLATFDVAVAAPGAYSVCYFQAASSGGSDGLVGAARELVGTAGLLSITAAAASAAPAAAASAAAAAAAAPHVEYNIALGLGAVPLLAGSVVALGFTGAQLSSTDRLALVEGASCPAKGVNPGLNAAVAAADPATAGTSAGAAWSSLLHVTPEVGMGGQTATFATVKLPHVPFAHARTDTASHAANVAAAAAGTVAVGAPNGPAAAAGANLPACNVLLVEGVALAGGGHRVCSTELVAFALCYELGSAVGAAADGLPDFSRRAGIVTLKASGQVGGFRAVGAGKAAALGGAAAPAVQPTARVAFDLWVEGMGLAAGDALAVLPLPTGLPVAAAAAAAAAGDCDAGCCGATEGASVAYQSVQLAVAPGGRQSAFALALTAPGHYVLCYRFGPPAAGGSFGARVGGAAGVLVVSPAWVGAAVGAAAVQAGAGSAVAGASVIAGEAMMLSIAGAGLLEGDRALLVLGGDAASCPPTDSAAAAAAAAGGAVATVVFATRATHTAVTGAVFGATLPVHGSWKVRFIFYLLDCFPARDLVPAALSRRPLLTSHISHLPRVLFCFAATNRSATSSPSEAHTALAPLRPRPRRGGWALARLMCCGRRRWRTRRRCPRPSRACSRRCRCWAGGCA